MKASILVVEDNEDLCKTIADVMKREGYFVKTAASGEEALTRIEKGLIDLVLLDIKLPRKSGLEVLARIRELVGPGLPIVITLDIHANLTSAMAAQAQAITIYRTYPHLDMAERGNEAATIMARILAGEIAP